MVRKNQKQIWSDRDFANWLERIRAERILKGRKVGGNSQLTKEMMMCPSFKNLEQELKEWREGQVNIKFKIKMDKKRLGML